MRLEFDWHLHRRRAKDWSPPEVEEAPRSFWQNARLAACVGLAFGMIINWGMVATDADRFERLVRLTGAASGVPGALQP